MARRIIAAKIRFISLCARGMNDLRTVYKAAQNGKGEGEITFKPVLKELPRFDERGLIAACVYAPNLVDLEEEWADADAIEKMAHDFVLTGGKLDVNHNEQPLAAEKAGIVESFVIQKNDPRFEGMQNGKGEVVDVSGGWGIIIKVNDPELRAGYRSGAWGGVSMGGLSVIRDEDPPQRAKKGTEMSGISKEELTAALKESNKDLGTIIAESIKSALTAKPAEKKAEEPEGDLIEIDFNDPEAVLKRAEELEFAKINKSDPKALREHAAKIAKRKADEKKAAAKAKLDATEGEGEGDGDEGDTEEVKTAKAALAEAQAEVERLRKASRQGAEGEEGEEGEEGSETETKPARKGKAPTVLSVVTALSKSDRAKFEMGSKFGKELNKRFYGQG